MIQRDAIFANGFFIASLRVPLAHQGLFYSCNLLLLRFLFATPYMAYSILLSGLYVCGLTVHQRIRAGQLPPYPDRSPRNDLFLVEGEIHDKRQPDPSETPYWRTIPERALSTGMAIAGAIGTAKTSCCMYPFAEQILAYRASDRDKQVGGLVPEVKGDFFHKVQQILDRHGRGRTISKPASALSTATSRFTTVSMLWRAGTVLAAGVHKPRQIHHPSTSANN